MRTRTLILVLAGFALSAWLASEAAAQPEDDREALARAIRAKVAELQQLQQRVDAERAQLADDRRSVEQQIDRLRADVASVRSRTSELEQRVADRRARIEELTATAESANRRIGAVAGRAAELAGSLAERAGRGIPSVQREADRLAGWREALAGAADGGRGDAIVALHEFIGGYLRSHRERTLNNRLVELRGTDVARHAYVARLGSIAEAFVTENGEASGIAARQAGAAWRSPLEPGRRERVVELIAILRKRSPPSMVEVPLMWPGVRQ